MASLGLHAFVFFFAPRDLRPVPVRPKPVAIEIVEIAPKVKPARDVDSKKIVDRDEPIAAPKPVVEKAAPIVQDTEPSEPVVEKAAPVVEKAAPPVEKAAPAGEANEAVVEKAPPSTGAKEAAGPDVSAEPGSVKLFAANALNTSVGSWKSNAVKVPGLKNAIGAAPDSPAAEAARVTGRVATTLVNADVWARVQGGFHSSCDDGDDNDIDGTIDCADPACRSRPECSNTGVYERAPWQEIPDADEIGLSSIIDVPQHGSVRKLTVRIQITHGSPGDVTLVLENMDTGATALLRGADRTDSAIAPAFYVRELQGTPAAGRWRLRVRDEFTGTSGKLKKWQLVITS